MNRAQIRAQLNQSKPKLPPMAPNDELALKNAIISKLTVNQPYDFNKTPNFLPYKNYILNKVYDEVQYNTRLLKNFKMQYPLAGGKSRRSRRSRRVRSRKN